MSEFEKAISQMCDLVTSLRDDNARLRAALTRVAAYDDAAASDYLRSTGSYRGFDEPVSVEIARTALESKP